MTLVLSPRRRPVRGLGLLAAAPLLFAVLGVVIGGLRIALGPLAPAPFIAAAAALAALLTAWIAIVRSAVGASVTTLGLSGIVLLTDVAGWIGVLGVVSAALALPAVQRLRLIREHNRWLAFVSSAERDDLSVFAVERAQERGSRITLSGSFLTGPRRGTAHIGVRESVAPGMTVSVDAQQQTYAAVPTAWAASYERVASAGWAVPVG